MDDSMDDSMVDIDDFAQHHDDAPLLPEVQDGPGGPTRWDLRYHDAQLEQDFNETFISDAVMPGFRLMWARKGMTRVRCLHVVLRS